MKTAFVFVGGGSLGKVEAGMLAALAGGSIQPDLVVGTSVGAINGVRYAAHPDSEGVRTLTDLWTSLSRNDIFPIRPVRGLLGVVGLSGHLVPSTALRRLLRTHLSGTTLDGTPTPAHVVGATDVLSGEEVSTGYACALERPPRSALMMASQALTSLVNHRLALDVERNATGVRSLSASRRPPEHRGLGPGGVAQRRLRATPANVDVRLGSPISSPASGCHSGR